MFNHLSLVIKLNFWYTKLTVKLLRIHNKSSSVKCVAKSIHQNDTIITLKAVQKDNTYYDKLTLITLNTNWT